MGYNNIIDINHMQGIIDVHIFVIPVAIEVIIGVALSAALIIGILIIVIVALSVVVIKGLGRKPHRYTSQGISSSKSFQLSRQFQ